MLPTEILEDLLEHALSTQQDAAGNQHYRLHGPLPQAILSDLRYAGARETLTVWQSPTYRAILMAAQNSGELVLCQSETQFRHALAGALSALSDDRTR